MEKLCKFLFLLSLCLFVSACNSSSAKNSEKADQNEPKAIVEEPIVYEPAAPAKDSSMAIQTTLEETKKSTSQQLVESEPVKKDLPKKTIAKPKKKKPKAKSKKYPHIVFDESEYDFGEIEQGESVKHNFVFKNTGKAPLSISKATATCGCTQPSFPFIDIMPDEEGYIGVSYFSVGKEGVQEPEISVFTNDKKNPVVTLKLKGFVHLPEDKKDTLKDTSGIDSPY